MTPEMEEQILAIAEQEILPFMSEGVAVGFSWGFLVALAVYGILKAIGLLNINNR